MTWVRPDPPSPVFSPETTFLGDDGRWYFEDVDVSDLPVGWKCSACQHRWRASISARVAGEGCPSCGGSAS